jgi:peptide/nickel transport system permease protein
MLRFLAKRIGAMALTMLCLSLIVFYFVNLEPNLKRLAIFQTEMRASQQDLENWLARNGYRDNFFLRYARWIGVAQKQPVFDPATKEAVPRFRYCDEPSTPTFSGVLEGDFGCSTAFKTKVQNRLPEALKATGLLMFWVMLTMIPTSLVIGVLAGMREGSRLDRVLSILSITSTATPEYVSGIVFSVIFATWLRVLNGSAATATSEGITFYNFALPVMTLAIYGVGYIARMARASMAEVMASQYIRTARLKGLSFRAVVMRHALRNALIAPFTVVMLQFPWLLSGVVVAEAIFRYQGFGFLLVTAASNNDIDLILACGLVSVVVVLITQLISDIGYAYLNPRIRLS